MIDVASGVAEELAVNIVLPIEGKDIDIALLYALGTFVFGNPLPNILANPGVFCDVFAVNTPCPAIVDFPTHIRTFMVPLSSLHALYPLSPPPALSLAEELGMRPFQAHCHRGLGTRYATTGQRTRLAPRS